MQLSKTNNIDTLKEKISRIRFSDKLKMNMYKPFFTSHLDELVKFYIIETKGKEIHLTPETYHGLEQFVLESDLRAGKKDENIIDWNYIDDAKEILEKEIKRKLGNEGHSEELKPFIESSVNAFENNLIFNFAFNLDITPWSPAVAILSQNGCLHTITSREDMLHYYNPRGENTGNLGVVAANKKHVKSSNESKFSAYIVNDNYSLNGKIYNYLLTSAVGERNQKNKTEIKGYFNSIGQVFDDVTVGYCLLSLKRQGLVGSKNSGYYVIRTKDDVKKAVDHHREKVGGILRTLNSYALNWEMKGDSSIREYVNDYLRTLCPDRNEE